MFNFNRIISRKQCRSFSTTIDKYSAISHSLLKQVYTYSYYDHYLGYILLDHATQSIIVVDPGDQDVVFNNVAMLRHQFNYNFTHILQTHGQSKHTKSSKYLHTKFENLKIISGDAGQETNSFYTILAQDLSPIIIGDLSVCFLKTPGHTSDSYIIAITDVNENSTKLPVLFTGDTLLLCSVGEISDYKAMHTSLQRIKGFPGETLVFPGHRIQKENLLFAKTLDPSSPAINIKLQILQEMEEKQSQSIPHMVPSSLLEERMVNPFLKFMEPDMQKILQEKDPIKCMQKLRIIQQKFFS